MNKKPRNPDNRRKQQDHFGHICMFSPSKFLGFQFCRRLCNTGLLHLAKITGIPENVWLLCTCQGPLSSPQKLDPDSKMLHNALAPTGFLQITNRCSQRPSLQHFPDKRATLSTTTWPTWPWFCDPSKARCSTSSSSFKSVVAC